MTPIPIERVTTALFSLLAEVLEVPVGDHGTDDIDTSDRYVVGWKIDGGEPYGSLGDAHQDWTLVYQLDSVGHSRQQAEGLADLVRNVMLDVATAGGHEHQLTGDGWTGGLRTQQTTGMPTPEGTDDTARKVWTQRERFEVQVFRAPIPEPVP